MLGTLLTKCRVVFCLCMALTFINVCTPSLWAIEVSEFSRELRIQENEKKIFSSASPSSQVNSNSYRKEQARVFKQLEVITGNEETRYIIVPGDSLTVSFYDRGEVTSAIYQVSGQGEIYLPLVGPTKVINLNKRQAIEVITKKLNEYIRHPKVDIRINDTGSVMVLGAVSAPGVYPLSSKLTAMEAILGARFSGKSAKLKNVVVMRGSVEQPVVAKLDLNKMIKKGDRSDNIFLKPGDLVYVPTTRMSNVEGFINTLYKNVLIWYGFGGQNIIEEGKPFVEAVKPYDE